MPSRQLSRDDALTASLAAAVAPAEPLYAVSLIVQQVSPSNLGRVSIRIWVGRAADEMAAGQAAVRQWASDAAKGRTPAERIVGSGASRLDAGGAPFYRVVTFVDPSAYSVVSDPEGEERGRQLAAEFPPAPDGGEDE